MNADPAFKQLLDKLPERDQSALLTQHRITSFVLLLTKKAELQQRQLAGVCSDVQMVLEVVCTYLESLDSLTSFTLEGLENFCDFDDKTGDYVIEDLTEQAKKKQKTEESDPDGYNLTIEERKQLEQSVEDDPLTMKIRGFSTRSLQFEFDENEKKQLVEDSSEKTEVAFNGNVYYVKKCYFFQQPNGESVIVGIRKFTRVSGRMEDCCRHVSN